VMASFHPGNHLYSEIYRYDEHGNFCVCDLNNKIIFSTPPEYATDSEDGWQDSAERHEQMNNVALQQLPTLVRRHGRYGRGGWSGKNFKAGM
jgi:hypothetical protein